MLISNSSSLGYTSPSARCREFDIHRPAVKAKLRSIIPTPFSLLVDVMIEPEQVTDSKDATAYTEKHPTEIYNVEENLPIIGGRRKIRDEFSAGSYNCGKSRRTEDIFIREDEDGVRSHYCPLKPELDGERDGNEDWPDRPMQFDFGLTDALTSNCSLASEEIPFLMAEKPSSSESEGSESEGNENSSAYCVSTSYAPLENRPTITESLFEHFFQQSAKTPPYRKLDEATMAEWVNDSSDEMEDYETDTTALQKIIVGDESDMEEFEEEIENMNRKLRKIQEKKYTDSLKNILLRTLDNKSPKNDVENGSSSGVFSQLSEIQNAENENAALSSCMNIQDENENVEENDINDLEIDSPAKNDAHCASNDGGNAQSSNLNSQIRNEDVKEKDVNNIEIYSAEKNTLCAGKDIRNGQASKLNSQEENENVREKDVDDSEICSLTKNAHCTDNDDRNGTASNLNSQGENENGKEEDVNFSELDPIEKISHSAEFRQKEIADSFNKTGESHRDVLDGSRTENQTGATNKDAREKNAGSLTMEPVAMNISRSLKKDETQPVLTEMQPFMTEVYHAKDRDAFYSEALSKRDKVDKISVRRKRVVPDNLQRVERKVFTDLPVRKSTSQSGTFEPLLTEEQRVEPKRQSKLAKFFQSFKKKLERTKKA